MNLLDLMNSLGSRIRYGVSDAEKYKLMASGAVPGQPQAFLPGGDENPEAVRYLSNYLGAQRWGEGPTNLVNQLRYLIDDDAKVFGAGIRGAKQASNPLQTLMASMSVRR